jgi:stromal membrane-associated protein
MNAYGIMVGSVLTCTVIEARELRSTRLTGSANPYVILSIEGQRSQTDQITGSADPVWNEIMSFDITTGKESLKVEVFDRSDIGRDAPLGECFISLDTLRDQYKHDAWFDLANQ